MELIKSNTGSYVKVLFITDSLQCSGWCLEIILTEHFDRVFPPGRQKEPSSLCELEDSRYFPLTCCSDPRAPLLSVAPSRGAANFQRSGARVRTRGEFW